jgi:hypothetical protein
VPFSQDTEVVVRSFDDNNFELTQPLRYQTRDRVIEAPVGMVTDFTSWPRVFASLLPPFSQYSKPGVLHDYLWRVGVPHEWISPVEADAIYRDALREVGVAFVHRWILWAAARWGALTREHGQTGWWRESWRVMLVTAALFPILLPLTFINALTFAVFNIVELILWVPTKVAVRLRSPYQTDTAGPQAHDRPQGERQERGPTISLGWKT